VTAGTEVNTLHITADFCQYIYSLEYVNLTTVKCGNRVPTAKKYGNSVLNSSRGN